MIGAEKSGKTEFSHILYNPNWIGFCFRMKSPGWKPMRPAQYLPTWLAALFLAGVLSSAAQLPDSQSDPLARIREAAKTNVEACSATGETLCEQVAPKIIANAQGDSPLAENLRRLALRISERKLETPADVVSWGVAAFRAAGVDVRTEKDVVPGKKPTAPNAQEIVVAEMHGREIGRASCRERVYRHV
jgi:hypothetical protein